MIEYTCIHLIIQMLQVQWVSWMKYAQEVVITPETSYSDIIVPTVDTVRISFLIDMLLSNKKPVGSFDSQSTYSQRNVIWLCC